MAITNKLRDPDGTLYNYVADGSSNQYTVIKIDTNGVGTVLANITDAPLAYVHSMFSTEHYAILIVWQADIDTSQQQTNLADSFKPWNATRETLFCTSTSLIFRFVFPTDHLTI